MVDEININELLGPLFTIKVVHYADGWNSDLNPPFSVLLSAPIKQMFTLSVGLRSSTYYGPQGPQGIQGPAGPSGGGTGGTSSSIEFIQASAAASWSFAHNLGRRPLAQVFLTSGELVISDVSVTTTHVYVTFAVAQSGFVVLT